jgi:hypothetical protein
VRATIATKSDVLAGCFRALKNADVGLQTSPAFMANKAIGSEKSFVLLTTKKITFLL